MRLVYRTIFYLLILLNTNVYKKVILWGKKVLTSNLLENFGPANITWSYRSFPCSWDESWPTEAVSDFGTCTQWFVQSSPRRRADVND